MRIYTRRGDRGETELFGGTRVGKNTLRIEACGQTDELNAVIGWCRSANVEPALDEVLNSIQTALFEIGAELATPPVKQPPFKMDETKVQAIENAIDDFEAKLEPLNRFVMPGGTELAARLQIARAVCRRAERHIVALSSRSPVNPEMMKYVNRLSDLLFVLARAVNHTAGAVETQWAGIPRKPKADES